MDDLVGTAWLAAALTAPDLVILDATLFLPHEGRDALAEFRAAHIAGARFFDINAIADPDTDLPHMVPAAGRLARLVAGLGVSNASRVVVYDQRGVFSAPRAWWLLRLFGHDRVAVLDGGLPAWIRDGHKVVAGEPDAPPAPARFVPQLRAAMLRGLGDMRHNLDSGAELVVDARSLGRFTAEQPELRPGLRGGHIPGAASLPYTDLLDADGTMLPPERLRARFAQAGVDGSRPVVTSCGSGVTAAVLTLGMARAGLPLGALYDGSWTEWAGHPDTPVETG